MNLDADARGTGAGVCRRWRSAGVLAGVLAVGVVVAGCGLLRQETVQTKSMLQSLVRSSNMAAGTNALEILQSEVMRTADLYVGAVAQATDEFRVQVPTPSARLAAQQWKLIQATAAYVNATGENPVLDAVDMAVLATLSRFVVEDLWVKGEFGESARPLLETHQRLEQEAWKVLGPYLSPEQSQDLEAILDEYRLKNPNARFTGAIRLPELATALGRQPSLESARRTTSIFNLLYLDPLAGLDPATQAVEQTRQLALRTIYYAQRAPMLLGWQVELTTYQLAAQPESRQVLGDLDGASAAVQSFARSAELLPGLIHTEREAALSQFFDGVSRERTNLVAELIARESMVRGLLPEVRQTLESGGTMAASVNTAIGSLDSFVRAVTSPDTNSPSSSPGRPFDVRDYGAAAEQIGAAARELNEALQSLDRTVPGLARLGDQATADAKAVVTHAFRLALILIVVAGAVTWLVLRFSRQSAAVSSASRG
ncbi:MAG: hypothetical protein RIS76_2243 [Verrucomicrobiota bacterium]